MGDFLKNLTPPQATIFSSVLSALIAIFVLAITKYFDFKKLNQERYDTAKKYANPIISAAEQLAWRIKEILEFNGAFLLPGAPNNGFFRYKLDSTIYRLCALIGWIQAAKKEQSYIEGLKMKQHKKIQDAVFEFQKRLADGGHVEISILDDLSDLFELNVESLNESERSLLGVELEKVIFKFIPDSIKKNAASLGSDDQINMLREIYDLICLKINHPKIDQNLIEEKRVKAITEISREFCWIYRDWQSAIGEEMIESVENANRRFEVIGFAKFQEKHLQNEWLQKVDNLFLNLDVSVDNRFDSRVHQLKLVYEATVELLITFRSLVRKQETVTLNPLNTLIDFNKKINGREISTGKKRVRFKLSFE